MDPDRLLTLTNAAALAGCSRKALERRVERGRLDVVHEGGQRMVCLSDLMRSGLVTLGPASPVAGPIPQRVLAAEAQAEALRTALVATEAALHRVRDQARTLRAALADADARASAAEHDLTRVLLDAAAAQRTPRGGRLRLRSA